MLKKITVGLVLIFWPLSLFLANTFPNFLNYLFPIFQPKFAILPLLFLILNFKKRYMKLVILSLILLIILWRPFFGQTIFKFDYEKGQQVLQRSQLYPNVYLARIFQNKARIPLDKFTNNFFALTDPNNYFFGFAPRQITVDNQNLIKFPFLSLVFILIALFNITSLKHRKIVLTFLIAAIINLSILSSFDRNDFILYFPLSILIIHGINVFNKKYPKSMKIFYLMFIVFSSFELIRIFVK